MWLRPVHNEIALELEGLAAELTRLALAGGCGGGVPPGGMGGSGGVSERGLGAGLEGV